MSSPVSPRFGFESRRKPTDFFMGGHVTAETEPDTEPACRCGSGGVLKVEEA